MNALAFNQLLQTIPYQHNGDLATGILAPLVRSMGHVLFLYAAISDTASHVPMTPEECVNELKHASDHLVALDTATAPGGTLLSSTGQQYIKDYCNATVAARDHWNEWEEADRPECLRNLANRAAGLAAYLDWELGGMYGSDAGSSL